MMMARVGLLTARAVLTIKRVRSGLANTTSSKPSSPSRMSVDLCPVPTGLNHRSRPLSLQTALEPFHAVALNALSSDNLALLVLDAGHAILLVNVDSFGRQEGKEISTIEGLSLITNYGD